MPRLFAILPPKVASCLFALVVCVQVTAAWAEPCQHLDAEATERYHRLYDAGIAATDDPVIALGNLLGAHRVCDADPELLIELASTSIALGECHLARWWVEQILELEQVSPSLRGRALQKATEFENQCPNSARFVITVADSETVVALMDSEGGGLEIDGLPFEGRIEAGAYRLIATQPDRTTVEFDVRLEANARTLLHVPRLLPVNSPGEVRVRCRKGVDSVFLEAEYPGECGFNAPIADAGERLKVVVHEQPDEISMVDQENRIVDVRVPEPLEAREGLRLSDWGWLAIGGGGVFLASGVALSVSAAQLDEQAHETVVIDSTGAPLDSKQSDAASAATRANVLSGVGITASVLGVAAIGAGVALVLWPDPPYGATVAPSLSDESASLGLSVTF